MIDKEAIKAKLVNYLQNIYDPELPLNIYDLGLIYDIEIEEMNYGVVCSITMTLTAPGCPVADTLIEQVEYAAKAVDEIDVVDLAVTFDPPWSEERISYEGRLELGLL
ncbi:MAG: iron-sulfur cluster assembly protein [Sulfurimonadaceae bacterium]|nr:iron-sulfur cluster assembly protein [Sulfurimonadaceae bacterium]